jgi:vacuolar-type H+-ATPase subunit E/Vma4
MAEAKQRSRLLAARHKFLDRLAKETEARLRASMASAPQAYHGLLKGLIKQAIQRLDGEQVVEVHARPVDLAVAKAATQVAVGEVMAAAKAAGKTLNITATTVADPSLAESSGGVVVTALAGRIRCNNTLEDRLKLVLHDLTPVIRDLLFPSAKAAVKTKPAIYFPHQVAHAAPPAGGAAHHAPAAAAVAVAAPAAAVVQQEAPVVVAAPVPEVVVSAPAIVSAGAEKDPFAF